jgi:hypothetical protein
MKREVMPKELQDIHQPLQIPRWMLLSSSVWELVERCTNEENEIFRSSIKLSFQNIKNKRIWRPVQGVMEKTLSVAHSEISGQISSAK